MEIDKTKTYFITGAAGFIGSFLAKRLLEEGCRVIGIDNINLFMGPIRRCPLLNRISWTTRFPFMQPPKSPMN